MIQWPGLFISKIFTLTRSYTKEEGFSAAGKLGKGLCPSGVSCALWFFPSTFPLGTRGGDGGPRIWGLGLRGLVSLLSCNHIFSLHIYLMFLHAYFVNYLYVRHLVISITFSLGSSMLAGWLGKSRSQFAGDEQNFNAGVFLQALPPDRIAAAFFHAPAQLDAFCGALCRSLAFERSAAALLVYAPPEGGAYAPLLPAAASRASQNGYELVRELEGSPEGRSTNGERAHSDAPLPSVQGGDGSAPPINGDGGAAPILGDADGRPINGDGGAAPIIGDGNALPTNRDGGAAPILGDGSAALLNGDGPHGQRSPRGKEQSSQVVRMPGGVSSTENPAAQSGQATARVFHTGGTAVLPRMPQGLALMTSAEAYGAVADVARTAGRVAALAGLPCP